MIEYIDFFISCQPKYLPMQHVHDCKLYNTFIAIRGKPVNAAKPTMRNIKMRVEDYVLAKLEVL